MKINTPTVSGNAKQDVWAREFFDRAQTVGRFGIWTIDLRTSHWRLSSVASQILGISASVSTGREALFQKLSQIDRLRVTTAWAEFLESKVNYDLEYALEEPGGARWIQEKAGIELDENNEPQCVVGVVQDISSRRSADAELVRRANFDTLTDIPNRSHLHAYLEEAMAASRHRQEQMALLLVDLDRFKAVNDRFGHQVGDLVLQAAAKRMQACLRESDMLARQGGDEFVAVLKNVDHDSTAGLIALRLIEEVSRPYSFNGTNVSIGASVGIALLPQDGVDASTLINRADGAMYDAKHAGRETLRFFEPCMSGSA